MAELIELLTFFQLYDSGKSPGSEESGVAQRVRQILLICEENSTFTPRETTENHFLLLSGNKRGSAGPRSGNFLVQQQQRDPKEPMPETTSDAIKQLKCASDHCLSYKNCGGGGGGGPETRRPQNSKKKNAQKKKKRGGLINFLFKKKRGGGGGGGWPIEVQPNCNKIKATHVTKIIE